MVSLEKCNDFLYICKKLYEDVFNLLIIRVHRQQMFLKLIIYSIEIIFSLYNMLISIFYFRC